MREEITTKEEIQKMYEIHGNGMDTGQFIRELDEAYFVKKEAVYDFLGLSRPEEDIENWDTEAVNPPRVTRKIKMVKVPELLKTRRLISEPEGFKGNTMGYGKEPYTVGCLLFLIPLSLLGYFI